VAVSSQWRSFNIFSLGTTLEINSTTLYKRIYGTFRKGTGFKSQ